MKLKLLFSFILFLIFNNLAFAQLSQGQHYLGGNLSYNYNSAGTTTVYTYNTGYTNYTTHNLTSFQIAPEFGYMLSKNWAIDVQPSYSRSAGTETSNFYSYTSSSSNYSYSKINITLTM